MVVTRLSQVALSPGERIGACTLGEIALAESVDRRLLELCRSDVVWINQHQFSSEQFEDGIEQMGSIFLNQGLDRLRGADRQRSVGQGEIEVGFWQETLARHQSDHEI